MGAQHRSASRRGQTLLIIGALALVIGASLITTFIYSDGEGSAAGGNRELHTVRRSSFDITIPVSGELVALQQIDIRNQLSTQAVITEIADEGKMVAAGDVLLKFNDEELRARHNDAIDEVNLAEAALVSATSQLDVTIKERESEIAKANLAVYLAELALQAWQDGEDKSKRKNLELGVETATRNYERLKSRFETSAALLDKQFISMDEYRSDEIAMIEARSSLEQAQIELELYDKYQSKQDQAKKTSDLDQARAELERTTQSYDAKVRSAQSEVDSKKHQLQSKRERKRLLEQQLSYCNITAPTPGLVVYSSSMESGRWGWGEDPPRVGSQVWPNQQIIILPDTLKMAAEVKVSEALSGMIKVGQAAIVTPDAMPGQTMSGEVISIGVLAASGGFRDPNRRDYTVKIALRGGNDIGLKPCMRCKANIKIDRADDVIAVPVQAVNRAHGVSYVYVPDRQGYSQRKVQVGRTSELFTEITEGLSEGDRVLLRQPQPEEIMTRLPEIRAGEQAEAESKFSSKPEAPGLPDKPESEASTPASPQTAEPTAPAVVEQPQAQ